MSEKVYSLQASDAANVAAQGAELTRDLVERYASFIDAKPRTVEAYAKSIKPFFLFASRHGVTRLNEVTRPLVIAYREELKGHYKPTTVQMYITALRLFVRWAAQEGLMENCADHLKGARLDREHKKDYLSAAQVRTLLGSIDRDTLGGKRDYAVLSLCATCGLRTIEIVRADVDDLRTLGGSAVLYVQGKGREERNEYVKVSPMVERVVREYLAARGAKDGEPLFSSLAHNHKGERLTTRAVSAMVKDTLKGCGFNSSRLTAHSLRHTAATLALLAGKPLEEVQQFMRHSQITTTMIYNHALDKARNSCASALSAAIFGGEPEGERAVVA